MTGRTWSDVNDALTAAGRDLPGPVITHGTYRPAVAEAGLVFTSGQIPVRDGRPVMIGRVGRSGLPTAEAAEAAAVCVGAALAAAYDAAGADAVLEPVKMVVFIAAEEDFTDLPAVANGASELLQQVFDSVPARSAVGVRTLPLNVPVEVELTCVVRGEAPESR